MGFGLLTAVGVGEVLRLSRVGPVVSGRDAPAELVELDDEVVEAVEVRHLEIVNFNAFTQAK